VGQAVNHGRTPQTGIPSQARQFLWQGGVTRGGSGSGSDSGDSPANENAKSSSIMVADDGTNDDNDNVTSQHETYVQNRWNGLMTYCRGNWSGAIAWYHVKRSSREGGLMLESDPNNYKLNMRLSFLVRTTTNDTTSNVDNDNDESDNPVADWIVYHAKGTSSRDHVVLEKQVPTPQISGPMQQSFYVFDEGILGRTGTNLYKFPVVEHGFWDTEEGMRRTVVLVYNSSTLELERVCFLQQAKRPLFKEFDVSDVNLGDIQVLPKDQCHKNPTRLLSEKERRKVSKRWGVRSAKMARVEALDGSGRNRATRPDDGGALNRLFGTEDSETQDYVRLLMPNGVMLSCPRLLSPMPATTSPIISLGYKRSNGQIQVLELKYGAQSGTLESAQGSWYTTHLPWYSRFF